MASTSTPAPAPRPACGLDTERPREGCLCGSTLVRCGHGTPAAECLRTGWAVCRPTPQDTPPAPPQDDPPGMRPGMSKALDDLEDAIGQGGTLARITADVIAQTTPEDDPPTLWKADPDDIDPDGGATPPPGNKTNRKEDDRMNTNTAADDQALIEAGLTADTVGRRYRRELRRRMGHRADAVWCPDNNGSPSSDQKGGNWWAADLADHARLCGCGHLPAHE